MNRTERRVQWRVAAASNAAMAAPMAFGSSRSRLSHQCQRTSMSMMSVLTGVSANWRETQRILRDLGSHLLAFGESEPAAFIVIKPFGFDPSIAGRNLIGLSNTLDRYGTDRATFRKNVEKALQFTS